MRACGRRRRAPLAALAVAAAVLCLAGRALLRQPGLDVAPGGKQGAGAVVAGERHVDAAGAAYWLYRGLRCRPPGGEAVQHDVGQEKEEENKDDELVTLVTQCTPDHLPRLGSLAAAWGGGPLAVAVFAPAMDVAPAAVAAMARHCACSPVGAATTTFALVVPADDDAPTGAPPSIGWPAATTTTACAPGPPHGEDAVASAAAAANYARPGVPYPNNLLRNVARAAAATPFTLVLDVDVLPFPVSLRRTLAPLLRGRRATKAVYVLPAFEVRRPAPWARLLGGFS
jgi:hypothetical protein